MPKGKQPGVKRSRSSTWMPVVLLALAAILSGYAFLAPGHPTTIDVWPHLSRQQIVYQSLKQGFSPFYTFMFYSGYPHLQFYSPLFAFVSGVLTLVTAGNLVLALKLLLFVLHLVSGWAMYLYLKHRTGGIHSAAVGTLVYLLIPWRVLYIAIGANYPQALIYLLLPLMFLAFEKVVERPSLRDSVLLALLLGLAVVSHIFYAAFAAFFLLVVLVFRLKARSSRAKRARSRLPVFLGVAGLGAIGIAAFFLIPFLAGFRSHLFPQPVVRLGTPDLAALLNPGARGGGYAGAYLGLSNVVLILLSVVAVLFSRKLRAAQTPVLIGLVLSLALCFVAPRLEFGPRFLTAGLPPVRFLVFFVFFGAVLAGSGYALLDKRLANSRSRQMIVLLVFLAVIAVDCLPRLLRVRYHSVDRFLPLRREVYQVLSKQNPSKVLDLHYHKDCVDDFRRLGTYPALGFLFGGMPGPLGPPYHQFAPWSMLYVCPFANLISAELDDSTTTELTPACRKAFALMGLTHIIALPTLVGSDEGTFYLAMKQGVDWDDRFVRADREPPLAFGPTGAGLVLASSVVKPVACENVVMARTIGIADDWQELLDAVEIELDNNHISFIPAKEDQAHDSLPGMPGVRVLESRVENSFVNIRVQTSADCFLRLALSYYPELRIMLDDRPVRFSETKDHFIWFRCPAGTHDISVTAPLSLLRKLMLVLSGLALCACIVALVVLRPRR